MTAAASNDGAAREPGLDLEPIKAALKTRDNRGSTHWEGCEVDARHRDCAIYLLIAEIERLRADLYVSRKHAADLQTELTLLERTVQPPVSDSLRDLIDHPVTPPVDSQFRDYYEAYVLRSTWPKGKSFATFAREIWDYLQASVPSSPAGR